MQCDNNLIYYLSMHRIGVELKKLFSDFVVCHEGGVNRVIHLIGFAMIGLGIWEKNIFLVLGGGIVQELGHVYQYAKTKQFKYNPFACLKPQSVFAYPIFILIILYVLFAK